MVMLGSSRTLVGLRPDRLTNSRLLVWNFGIKGAGPMMQLVCLRRLLGAGIRPDHLFVEVLPLCFNQPQRLSVEELWFHDERLTFDEALWLRDCHSRPWRLMRHWLKSRSMAGIRFRAGFGACWHCRSVPSDADRFGYQAIFDRAGSPEDRRRWTSF